MCALAWWPRCRCQCKGKNHGIKYRQLVAAVGHVTLPARAHELLTEAARDYDVPLDLISNDCFGEVATGPDYARART